jgi:4-hydroxy-tetrahydrodipicolinate synthase
MNHMEWTGVIPAITTPFNEDLSINHAALAAHCRWMIQSGCTGVVALGSLGEGAALNAAEKEEVLRTCVEAIGGRAAVIAGVSALSTAEAVSIARMASNSGCNGLMVLPPYVYVGDWREIKAHVSAVLRAAELPAMLYNNPIAYTVDFLPAQVLELLQEHENLQAIKESSADVRRVTALRAISGNRLQILCGVDDLIVEAIAPGAVGWIAGLANALPEESVALFRLATAGSAEDTFELYRWFLPLLRMDTVPKFVQLIKLVQQTLGKGSSRVRPPRLELAGAELQQAMATIENCIQSRKLTFPTLCRS